MAVRGIAGRSRSAPGRSAARACSEYARGRPPDVQFNVMPLSVDKPGDPLHAYSGFTASVWQCHPASRGRVAIRSTNPLDQPRIEPRYFSEDLDRQDDRRRDPDAARDLSPAAFRDLWEVEVLPGPQADDDKALYDFARNTGGTVFHPVGTCRMGNDEGSVVDPQLRVRGVERAARDRCVGDADGHVGELECRVADDRRKGIAAGAAGGRARCFVAAVRAMPSRGTPGPIAGLTLMLPREQLLPERSGSLVVNSILSTRRQGALPRHASVAV
jgi:hypothetical protein